MKDFFTPISAKLIEKIKDLPSGVLGKQIIKHDVDYFPDITNASFALFGVKESRNDINYNGLPVNFDSIRESFYSLYPGNWTHTIVDLGDIEAGATVKDTYFAVESVIHTVLKNNTIPIILGGSQDIVIAQYKAYNKVAYMINYVNIDRKFDLGDADAPITNTSYVGKLITEKPYNLFNYSVLGYQSYFNSPQEISLMEKLFFDASRLGEIIGDITVVEPILRNAHMVSLDIHAIKNESLSYKGNNNPNGLDSREICAISRYAGISNSVSSFGVYEIKNEVLTPVSAMLIAQIIWYFIEGVNFRVKDDDFNNEKLFKTFKVPINDEVLIFKKSNKTGRWWIELPFMTTVNNKLKSKTLLPCTNQEYLSACNQEIPERWYKARRKNEV